MLRQIDTSVLGWTPNTVSTAFCGETATCARTLGNRLTNRLYSSRSRSIDRLSISSLLVSKVETPVGAKLPILFFGMIALVVPFAVGTENILNHFYRFGAYLFDSGLLAYLMAHTSLAESLPRVLGGGSFYALHVSPIFLLLSELARTLATGATAILCCLYGRGAGASRGGCLLGPGRTNWNAHDHRWGARRPSRDRFCQ